jgi:N-acetylglucosaminyldiphosphoundecaprenol N-acetyl-beta-D-mannosaminyltransferase
MSDRATQARTTPWSLVNVPSQADLLADLRDRLRQGAGFAVATLNLDHVVKLRRDPGFRTAYLHHSHVTADGRPVVWLSRLAGGGIALVTGSDLVDPLAELCADTQTPVALVGSTEAVLAAAADVLTARHPGLRVIARIAPPMGFDPDSAAAGTLIAQIEASGAGLCLLALGAPKQEILAARITATLPRMGVVSVGAGLDFLAGTQLRAPRLMRAFAAEWLWRLMRDPGRLAGRYAACAAVLPGLAGRAVAQRVSRRGERAG